MLEESYQLQIGTPGSYANPMRSGSFEGLVVFDVVEKTNEQGKTYYDIDDDSGQLIVSDTYDDIPLADEYSLAIIRDTAYMAKQFREGIREGNPRYYQDSLAEQMERYQYHLERAEPPAKPQAQAQAQENQKQREPAPAPNRSRGMDM